MKSPRLALLALACGVALPSLAQDLVEFSSQGLPRSDGIVVRVSHPPTWRKVASDDEMALAQLQGPQGDLTGILQIGRGLRGEDTAALCRPERAQTMLQGVAEQEQGTRVTDVVARQLAGRPAYELRYERSTPPELLVVRSVIVCLKDSRVVVSCAGLGKPRGAVAAIEPVCRQVLDSLSITED